MAQLGKDSFAAGDGPMAVEEGVALLAARIAPVAGIETVGLADLDGRVLAAPILAPIDLPPFDNSAVDGYAVRHGDLAVGKESRFPVVARIAAGMAGTPLPDRSAIRIFTGAPMPPGADTVYMQEDTRLEGGEVILPAGLAPGANRRLAGEDAVAGHPVLAAGRRLVPQDVALLAALGLAGVPVRRRLKVAVFSTGDEVVPPGQPLRPGALHDSNRFALMAMLRRLGCDIVDLGILADERAGVGRAVAAAAASCDLVVTSGGVSMGEEDHVRAALSEVGSLVFWKLAIKPGRPVAMGIVAGTPVVGLPGNPVAVFVTFAHVVRPLLAALAGEAYAPPAPVPVVAGFSFRKKTGRREYLRVRLLPDGSGRPVAHLHPREGAAAITSLTETDGFVVLPEDRTVVEPGEALGFLSYAVLR
ncbi:gephyrin-like molybdotransferase Glp [uncultured Alsobacter sp.]|uniref:molybdopterin molybdotransferase MoeA n=1 Tax=uncultured Alsobacter sp. TaxID=1748258 RepID=UPI0025FE9F81|nr:gephyrin-like molybdotransferase Glp [uncultured Alsobacter sp.]